MYERREKEGKDGKKVYFFAPTDQYFAVNPDYDEKYIIYQHGQVSFLSFIYFIFIKYLSTKGKL